MKFSIALRSHQCVGVGDGVSVLASFVFFFLFLYPSGFCEVFQVFLLLFYFGFVTIIELLHSIHASLVLFGVL